MQITITLAAPLTLPPYFTTEPEKTIGLKHRWALFMNTKQTTRSTLNGTQFPCMPLCIFTLKWCVSLDRIFKMQIVLSVNTQTDSTESSDAWIKCWRLLSSLDLLLHIKKNKGWLKHCRCFMKGIITWPGQQSQTWVPKYISFALIYSMSTRCVGCNPIVTIKLPDKPLFCNQQSTWQVNYRVKLSGWTCRQPQPSKITSTVSTG